MNLYFFTPEASRDLEEIHDYIAEENLNAAINLMNLVEEKCQLIAQFPEMGRKREELTVALRSFSVGNYVVFYRIHQNNIQVIRILNGACDIETIFEEED